MTKTHTDSPAEQLTLLPNPTGIPAQFRLDVATRQRGLRHIAEIRARLERDRPTGSPAPPGRRPERAA
jgi:hypothetical protein